MTKRLMMLALGLFTALASTALAEDGKKIGFIYPTLNNPFFVDQSKGADKAAAEFGGTMVHLSGDNQVAKQVQQMEDLIAQKVDAIVIQAVDTGGIVAAVKEANVAGIPVFTTGERITGADVKTAVFFDNIESGELGGKWISDNIGGGNVFELIGILGTETARQKSEGFKKGLLAGKNGDKFKIVASQPADYDRTKALQVTENVLQANDIAVIYAANDEMALGAARAVEEAGLTGKVTIVGNDGTADAIEAVKGGSMAATIATPGYLQGFIAVETALKHLSGVSVPAVIPEKSTPITKENAQEADSVLHGTAPEQRYWESLYGK